MRILIVEDEPPIAENIKKSCQDILPDKNAQFSIAHTLSQARSFLTENDIDLCFLDLNLSGEDGFELLKQFTVKFYTIIISAYSEKALEAFEFGVLDFIAKPFNKIRLKKALDRFFQRSHNFSSKAQYLIVHKNNEDHLVPVSEIIYLKACRYLIEIHLKNGKTELIEKSLNKLSQILPPRFIRVHRSYILDHNYIQSLKHQISGKYQVTLKNGEKTPVNRQQYKNLKQNSSLK